MADSFENVIDTLSAPASRCFEITAADGADLALATRAIYVGQGGNIVLRSVRSDVDVTLTNVPSGTILPIRAASVSATGTTASNIVGLA